MQYKTVVQLYSGSMLIHKGLIRQAINLQNALPSVVIEIVAHGHGVDLLLYASPLSDDLQYLHERGVQFLVCQQALAERNIEESSLLPFVKIVPSAVAHLVVRQEEGWSYLKAG